MKKITKIIAALLLVISICSALTGCEEIINGLLGNGTQQEVTITELNIEGEEKLTLNIGDIIHLKTDAPKELVASIEWSASNECVTASGGTVRAIREGTCVVFARYGKLYDKVLIEVVDEVVEDNFGGGGNNSDDSSNDGNGRFTFGNVNTDSVHKWKPPRKEIFVKETNLFTLPIQSV